MSAAINYNTQESTFKNIPKAHKAKSKTPKTTNKKLEVLFQRLGNKIYAFTVEDGQVFWSDVPA